MSEITKLEQSLSIKKIDNETINISINNNEMLLAMVGQFDQNLKSLSKLTNTDVFFRVRARRTFPETSHREERLF